MVKHLTPVALLLALVPSSAGGVDAARERRARVALALAATRDGPPVAPAPRTVPLPGYAGAYRLAVERGEPLVLYVGCAGRHHIERVPNAVVGTANELAGYEPGTVVIAYPHEGAARHALLRCSDHGDPVARAVQEARKKIAAPPGKAEAAPVPLRWDV